MMRRPGELLPLEEHILLIGTTTGAQRSQAVTADGWFHAYAMAQALSDVFGGSLAKNGTLYRSLKGLASRGAVEGRLETADEAATHSGPARRYFRVTPEGKRALAAAEGQRRLAKGGLTTLPVNVVVES